MTSRINSLKRMFERNPNDARIRFGLAMEDERLGRWVRSEAGQTGL